MDLVYVPTDTALRSTVGEILVDCPKFRILVLGKTGCGKSSLINRVFGVDIAQVSHINPGPADINFGFCPESNARFILHDSQGFEPGNELHFNVVNDFIEKRNKMHDPQERLHAIWICFALSVAGDRVLEAGVEKILNMDHGEVPIIAIFTKYDLLVTSAIYENDDDLNDEEELWLYGDKVAQKKFEQISSPLINRLPTTKVSTQPRYSDTITDLIKLTDKEVQKYFVDDDNPPHTKPTPLVFAVAQRGDPNTSIEASVDVGRRKYWSGLLTTTDFTGKELRRCIDAIHHDIVSVWNIFDPSNYLNGENFKARMSLIINDLVRNPDNPTSSGDNVLTVSNVAALAAALTSPVSIAVASVGMSIKLAVWVSDVYQHTSSNVAAIMGYIVDLTIVMHRLSSGEASEERVVNILTGHTSGELVRVHNDIRRFVGSRPNVRLVNRDYVFDEITRLIGKYVQTK